MVIEYECRRCGKTIDWKQYEKSKFCPICYTRLRQKNQKYWPQKNDVPKIEVPINDINLDYLFSKYYDHKPIKVGPARTFSSVDTWISIRKRKYNYFCKKFSKEKNDDYLYVSKVFEEWLQFRNNLSWTKLPRKGTKALSDEKKLGKMLKFLRNQNVPIEKRVWQCLKGRHKINGIGPGILTALLHTFEYEKNGVWNQRTTETLDILNLPVKHFVHIGKKYVAINNILTELANHLSTDLTTIDGFMWFVSKHVTVT